MDALLPLLEQVRTQERPLLVIARDIEGAALVTLSINKLRDTLKVAAIKTPGATLRQKEEMSRDIALLTGGRLVERRSDCRLIQIDDLGSARKIIINRDTTTMIEAGAVLKTSAVGDPKIERKRVENVLAATFAALQEGIVPSVEAAFLYARRSLVNTQLSDADEERGFGIVVDALEDPLQAIAEDLAEEGELLIDLLGRRALGAKKSIELFVESGGIDAAKVVCAAVDSAAKIAMSSLKINFGFHLDEEESSADEESGAEEESGGASGAA
jgi:chaperonin GroEL